MALERSGSYPAERKTVEMNFHGGVVGTTALIESSPLVTLLGLGRCGLTASGAFGCVEDNEYRMLFQGMKQVSHGGDFQCAIAPTGTARCRGSNTAGECGIFAGLFRSDQPVEVIR
jgi:hypothetical protein